uniref:Uncharacterized protein n=1 Tax=Globisporangium ultimum (strain ATCC 200006 / CBS 805.95 / DAOM BR144) TaxID=431595 RepID=K3WVY0_GLOUD
MDLQVHPIDYRGARRKPFSEIEKEINQIKRQMEAYRTSYIKKKPNVEKEKLQQVFQYSQGTILPRELLPGSELLDRELSHANALRVGRKPKDRLEQLEELYDSVLEEIETRKTFMSEMITLGKPDQAAPMEREILERMSELRKIHQLMLKEKQKDNNAAE